MELSYSFSVRINRSDDEVLVFSVRGTHSKLHGPPLPSWQDIVARLDGMLPTPDFTTPVLNYNIKAKISRSDSEVILKIEMPGIPYNHVHTPEWGKGGWEALLANLDAVLPNLQRVGVVV